MDRSDHSDGGRSEELRRTGDTGVHGRELNIHEAKCKLDLKMNELSS